MCKINLGESELILRKCGQISTSNLNRIGLIGYTGTGKSSIARHLRDAHGYAIASAGSMCRAVCNLVFGNEDKANLNAIDDALVAMDRTVFLKAALRGIPPNQPVVLDSLRTNYDYEYALSEEFVLVRVVAQIGLRKKWLKERNQKFDFIIDGAHSTELELSNVQVDFTITNSLNEQNLHVIVDDLLFGSK